MDVEFLIGILQKQAAEITAAGHNGWGNTMTEAAAALEAVYGAATGSAVAAIQFALGEPEGMTFLRLWNEGEFDTLRREWPYAPAEVYVGADPLTQQSAPL